MTAHVWAQQTQDHGRSGHEGVSFQGTTFYSYSTPIANFVADRHGARVCLFTDNSYSPTTGKHKHLAERAVPTGIDTYTVHHVGAEGGYSPRLRGKDYYSLDAEGRLAAAHRTNVEVMLANYREKLAAAARPRVHRWGLDRNDFAESIARIRDYADRFGVTEVTLPDLDSDWQTIEAAIAKRNTPEAIAKREKAAKRRQEKNRADYRNVTGTFDEHFRGWVGGRELDLSYLTDDDRRARAEKLGLLNQERIDAARNDFRNVRGRYDVRHETSGRFDIYAEHFTAEDRAERARNLEPAIAKLRVNYRNATEPFGPTADWQFRTYLPLFNDDDHKAREARIAEINADKIKAWREGVNVRLPHEYDAGALLRLSRDGTTIETSWGATFPTEHGTKAFSAIKAVRESGREYVANGHRIHLGHFVIDRVTAEGDVFAGCHKVKWQEVEGIARQLNLI
jgi:hypothetical protein